jgi:hypothetical protein
MVPAVHKIYRMDSQDLAGSIFHPLVATFSIFRYNWCCRGGGQACSTIRATTCTDCGTKVLRFALFNNSHPVFFCQIFVLIEGGVLVPSDLYKLTLIGPSSMRDDLHSYLLPLLLQLFQILNVYLNGVFEEFVLFIFSQLIESLQG